MYMYNVCVFILITNNLNIAICVHGWRKGLCPLNHRYHQHNQIVYVNVKNIVVQILTKRACQQHE